MNGQIFIIKFYKREIFLVNVKSLPLSIANLGEAFNNFNKHAYWKIKILNYDEINFTLRTEIISYHTGNVSFPLEQIKYESALENIKVVYFTKIDTSALYQTYTSSKTDLEILPTTTIHTREFNARRYEKPKLIDSCFQGEKVIHGANTTVHLKDVDPFPTVNINKTETVEINIEEVKFGDGFISFIVEKFYLKDPMLFQIFNSFIKEEFEAIKNYFINIFQTNKLQVEITYVLVKGLLTESRATCKTIENIDNRIIEAVKLSYLTQLPDRINNLKTSKVYYTKEDLLTILPDSKIQLEKIFNDEKSFVQDIFEMSSTKHFKQLNYLSGKHCFGMTCVKFILNPFSFIFITEGKKNFNLVWETLDTTEATYIWKLDKKGETLNSSIKTVETTIASIKAKTDGKLSYLSLKEDNFNRVFHDYSDIEKGFITWKKEMDILLN